MATFDAPDYEIGNSGVIQQQLSAVLTQLDQALQALVPSPATNVVQFNNTVVLADPVSSNINTMSNGLIYMTDGSNSLNTSATSFNLTDNSGITQLTETINEIDFQNTNTSLYCQMGTLTQHSGLNGIEAFNSSAGTFFQLSTDTDPNNPTLALLDNNGVLGSYTASSILLDGASAGRPTRITLLDGTYTGTLTTTTWSGDCAGSAGSSTYASSVNIVDLSTGTNYPILYNSITTAGYNSLSMDIGTGNHFNYSPATNKINIGGTTNGGIAVVGTASTISVAGTGTALSCPNATAINFGSATITGGTFNGALSGTATYATNVNTTSDTTSATNCPVGFFVNSSGQQATKVNSNLNFQPSTNTLTCTTFSGALTGTASSATNVGLTSDNTSGTYYIPFAKTSGTGSKPLYIDDTTTALTYNPNTATLTTSVFVGGTINGTSGVLLQYNGTTQSSITTNGVQETLLTTQGTATYSSPTLTILTTASAPYPTTYGNIITFSGSAVAQTISAITVPTNMPINGMYYCYITNSNTLLGAITINATSLGTGIKTTYTSAVIIPISGFALGTLTKVGSSAFVWSVNVVA